MRALKFAGWILAVVLLVAVVGIAAIAVGGAPLVAKLIETRGSSQLGRKITIGRLEIAWRSPIRIVAEDVHVANADWATAPDLFAAPRIEAELDPVPLLGLRLAFARVALDRPELALETAAEDGRGNWQRPSPTTAAPGVMQTELRHLVVRQGHVTKRDGRTGSQWEMVLDELGADTPDRVHPIAVTARGVFRQQPFSVQAELAPLAELHQKSWPSPVRLEGRLGGNTVTAEGTAADVTALQDLDLHVDMAGDNLQQVLAALGVPIPRVPLYRLAGHLQRKDAAWTIEEMVGHIGSSQLGGTIVVDAGGPVPAIRANLTASYLDLADLKGFYGGEPGAGASARKRPARDGRVIPDFRIPREQLLGFNADLTLDAAQVKPTAGIPFEHLFFHVAVEDGSLAIRPAKLAVAGGEIAGDLDYRSTEQPPRLALDLELSQINLERLLAGTGASPSIKQTAGVVGGSVALRSAGERQRQLLAGLAGSIGLFAEEGRVAGKVTELLDLRIAEALGLVAKNNEPLPIQCFIARFDVTDGIATAAPLILDTPRTTVSGTGTINIADETLSLDLAPYPKRDDNSLGNVRVPISVRGTFAHPEFSADKTGTAARLGEKLGLARVTIPPALLPFVPPGVSPRDACRAAIAAAWAAHAGAAEGSSTAPASRSR